MKMTTYKDWIDITCELIENETVTAEFFESQEYVDAFTEWAIKRYPEKYGND
jgi:hypothetical protein